jgi:hypothetical protein
MTPPIIPHTSQSFSARERSVTIFIGFIGFMQAHSNAVTYTTVTAVFMDKQKCGWKWS